HHRVEVVDVDAEVGAGGVAVAAALAPGRLVAAGAEGLVAGAGEDHHAAAPVPPGGVEGVDQLVDRLGPEGVVLVRPVDGDRDDAGLVAVVEDVLVGHGCGPPSGVSGPGSTVRRASASARATTSRRGRPVWRATRTASSYSTLMRSALRLMRTGSPSTSTSPAWRAKGQRSTVDTRTPSVPVSRAMRSRRRAASGRWPRADTM